VKTPAVKPNAKTAKVALPAKAAKLVADVKPAKTVVVSTRQPVAKAKPAVPVKPAAKTQPVAPVKPVTKAKSAPTIPPAPVSKPASSLSKKMPVTTTVQTESASKPRQAAKIAKPEKSVVTEPQLTALGIPVRSGRPSSRLAQLTVPSMAQSVASTAAKASFTQVTTTQPIASPLASAVKKDPKLANNWKTKPLAELTDADVMAMSDDDYMNVTQLAFFRLKLMTIKNEILASAGQTTEHLREDTAVVPDPADRATIEEEHALELRTRDRERKLLKKIDQSINRIDAGDYGYCDETGEAIGVGRLIARPTATLSLEAQQRRELKQKMFGD